MRHEAARAVVHSHVHVAVVKAVPSRVCASVRWHNDVQGNGGREAHDSIYMCECVARPLMRNWQISPRLKNIDRPFDRDTEYKYK
eukprot:4824431-Prymnesium_polylepis.1